MKKNRFGFEFWDKEKENVLRMYLDEYKRIGIIAKEYGCYPDTITRQLRRWGVYDKYRGNSTYRVNHRYFEVIDTEEKAYFLGLLLADGHISHTVMLYMKDLEIIEKFKTAIESEHPIKYDRYNTPGISVASKHMVKDLEDKGFHNRKSYGLDFNKVKSFVPDDLLHHFVRGMFDGDGSIRVYRYPYLKRPQYHFGYTGTFEICNFIKSYLGINRKLVDEKGIAYTCVTRDIDLIREIYDILYKDATIYLKRKYETFQKEIL